MNIEWKDIKDCPDNKDCLFEVHFNDRDGGSIQYLVGFKINGKFYLNTVDQNGFRIFPLDVINNLRSQRLCITRYQEIEE